MSKFLRIFLCLGILTLTACNKSDDSGGGSSAAPAAQNPNNNQGQPTGGASDVNADKAITACSDAIKSAQPLISRARQGVYGGFGYVQEVADLDNVTSSLNQLQLTLDSTSKPKSDKVQSCNTTMTSSISKLNKTYNAVYAAFGTVQETVDLKNASNMLSKALDATKY